MRASLSNVSRVSSLGDVASKTRTAKTDHAFLQRSEISSVFARLAGALQMIVDVG